MTKASWVCSSDPQDCGGPFRSVRRPGDLARADDLGHCLVHRVQAYRMLTRAQQKGLGLRHREAVDFVEEHRTDARWDADEVLGLHLVGDGDGALDGPLDEEDRDGLTEWTPDEEDAQTWQPSDAELVQAYATPPPPAPTPSADLADVDPLSALTDSRLRGLWPAQLDAHLALALDAYLEDERA